MIYMGCVQNTTLEIEGYENWRKVFGSEVEGEREHKEVKDCVCCASLRLFSPLLEFRYCAFSNLNRSQ